MKSILSDYRIPTLPGLPPFQGGAAGLFSYELGRSLERLPRPLRDDLAFPDLSLGLYDVVVAFDRLDRRAWIMSTGLPEKAAAARRERASARGLEFQAALMRVPRAASPGALSIAGWTSNFTRGQYEKAVAEVIERILAGDIFQANLAQRFAAPVPPDFDHFGFYRRLRRINPAPFAAYLDHASFIIASASPERFLRVADNIVETRPIKGTRPRFADALVDMLQAKALSESRKDRAENVMIVDLLRNDLSKVCTPGSVKTPQLCGLESYATVHHLVSMVIGRLAEGFGPVDLLAAAFPGGSITGAPKLRAMEIITELEGHARGPYCGAIGLSRLQRDDGFEYRHSHRRLSRGLLRRSVRRRHCHRLRPRLGIRRDARQGAADFRGLRRRGIRAMILVIDNYDSFVHTVASYLRELGETVAVVRNDAVLPAKAPQAIVISPGPCTPNEAGMSMQLVRDYSGRLPILGVCLGHQAIGQVFGGRVARARRPMHGEASAVRHSGAGILQGLPNPLTVGRYHSLIVELDDAEGPLEATAWSQEGEIMALRHRRHNTFGVQFHPELILTEEGHRLLRNFLGLIEGRAAAPLRRRSVAAEAPAIAFPAARLI